MCDRSAVGYCSMQERCVGAASTDTTACVAHPSLRGIRTLLQRLSGRINILDAITVLLVVMKGYYTVRAEAPGCAAAQRIALEAAYARALEDVLGGGAQATALCLQAAAQGVASTAGQHLLAAREQVESPCNWPCKCRPAVGSRLGCGGPPTFSGDTVLAWV